jgi:hypothetical protein
MEDLHFSRALNSGLVGGLFGGLVILFIRLCLQLNIGVRDIFPGVVAGAVVGFVPYLFLPPGFSLLNDITTLTFRGMGTFCLWIVADGLMKGEIHGLPKGGFVRGFMTLISWKEYAPIFLMCVVYWSVLAVLWIGGPIFYFRKAIRDTSPLTPLPRSSRFSPIYDKWKESPENLRVIFIFTVALSSILVFFYLALLLGP